MPENQTVSSIDYDDAGDVLRVMFGGRSLDEATLTVAFDGGDRLVHYTADGVPVAMEFPHASRGLDLDGAPHGQLIAEAAARYGLPAGGAAR